MLSFQKPYHQHKPQIQRKQKETSTKTRSKGISAISDMNNLDKLLTGDRSKRKKKHNKRYKTYKHELCYNTLHGQIQSYKIIHTLKLLKQHQDRNVL